MEHKHSVKVKVRYSKTPLGQVVSEKRYRAECSCGVKSRWGGNEMRQRKWLVEHHGVNGQIGMEV